MLQFTGPSQMKSLEINVSASRNCMTQSLPTVLLALYITGITQTPDGAQSTVLGWSDKEAGSALAGPRDPGFGDRSVSGVVFGD
jgi:hypothetical protein